MGHSHPPVVLSEELRVRMLKSMCTDERMAVCEKEIGTIEPRTMPTLLELQKDYPEAELYSVMGADKINLLVCLTERRGFLNEFRVVLFSREETAIEEIIKRNSVLSPYIQRIVTLPQPEGTDNISSSTVRAKMLSGESTREYLCDGVWKLFRDFELSDFPDIIKKFTGEYAYLSNRFGCKMIWKGVRYSNAEAAVLKEEEQMSPSEWEAGCNEIMEASGPSDYKKLGRKICGFVQEKWDAVKYEIVVEGNKAKFSQNPEIREFLLSTGKAILVEASPYDKIWGIGLDREHAEKVAVEKWTGENLLGCALMETRDWLNDK